MIGSSGGWANGDAGPPTSSTTASGKPPPDNATTVKVPLGEVSTGAAKGGRPGDDALIARNRWRFKACYNKALAMDPGAGGSVSFTIKVGADGVVTSVTSSAGLPASLDACARGALMNVKFDPGPAATLVVPVVFSAKK